MSFFSNLFDRIRQAVSRMISTKNIESATHAESPLTQDMQQALRLWHDMYTDKAPWTSDPNVKSLNLAAMVCSEIARQVVLEMKCNITGKINEETNIAETNPRAEFLAVQYEKLQRNLRVKIEQGCGAGGMVIKPYTHGENVYFDYTMAWNLYPVAFDDDGKLMDVIFPDQMIDGKYIYTKLERHELLPDGIRITNRVYRSESASVIGVEVPLEEVPQWSDIQPEVLISGEKEQLFGYFKVPIANNIDDYGPMGMSVFHRATEAIKQADMQYSRLLWEFEGSELAIHADANLLKKSQTNSDQRELAKFSDRLYRKININPNIATAKPIEVFSPTIREQSLIAGLNQIFMRVEDLCGLARGSISDANDIARTATELKIVKDRTYTTISEIQKALEVCLRDTIRAMDRYATLFNLAPEGEYDVSFEWDDSIITDTAQQLQERLELYSNGMVSKVEMRMWYFGETRAQAERAIVLVDSEKGSEPTENDLDTAALSWMRNKANGSAREDEKAEGVDEDKAEKEDG